MSTHTPRVLRIIARLNVGGPARHALVLNAGLRAHGFESVLVYGSVGPGEGSLEDLVAASDLRSVKVPWLGRRISLWSDARALYELVRVIFREQPDIVHTHTAKAGTLGRLAAFIFNLTRRRGRRCAVVHTFHGHVFAGYFRPAVSFAVRWTERIMACLTDRVVAISGRQRDDICDTFQAAPPWKTTVVELGLHLDHLLRLEADTSLRTALGFEPGHVVFGYVGRLVPIKDLPTLIRGFALAASDVPEARLMIAGDGELRSSLEALADDLGVGERVRFAGWQRDLAAVYGAMDVGILSSRNEGTPVALIEAMAAGKPVVATAVGGVEDIVTSGQTGWVVPPADAAALAAAMRRLARTAGERQAFGRAARCSARGRFSADRLVADVSNLYLRTLVERRRLPSEHEWTRRMRPRPLRALGVIARLNIGGPARHAVVLSEGLRARGFEPVLVHGSIGAGEGSLDDLAEGRPFRSIRLPALGRQVHPWGDLRAFYRLVRLMYRERPDIVHTHTAKAGTLGRLAALAFNVSRPRARRSIVIHTFHGHVFSGYFGRVGSAAVRAVERGMSLLSDRIVTISASQKQEICERYRVAAPEKVDVVELGIVLEPLLRLAPDDDRRQSLGFAADDLVFGYVGRLVPIKNLEMLVRAFAAVVPRVPRARLALVGDGELRHSLRGLVRDLALDDLVRFTGWQRDLEMVYGSMDVCVLSSKNEGTPVALIEAMAAARPVIATAVGGVSDVVRDGRTGIVVPVDDVVGLSEAMIHLAENPAERRRMGLAGRQAMASRFAPGRLVDETADLYVRTLVEKRGTAFAPDVPAALEGRVP
jgi:glycosyltransferase involved in cell wall biosynthesis